MAAAPSSQRADGSLRAERAGHVLTITLDTPGEVNVFTRDAATHLREVLADLDPRARVVVFRTGKPHSFVNGVGLLLAGTLQSADSGAALIRPVLEAYRALRDCPLPTIAAIEGNCYGCGVELALQCRYRLAVDTFDTHFRMTELADYLFLPTFGGTQELPRLLGLKRAIAFVLWGERWSAREAAAHGLVDGCESPGDFEATLQSLSDRLAEGDLPATARRSDRRDEALAARDACAERIAALPPALRETYAKGLELMTDAAFAPVLRAEDYDREIRESSKSLMADASRAAWPFFFVRQSARALARTGGGPDSSRHLAFESQNPEFEAFANELSMRCAAPQSVSQGPVESEIRPRPRRVQLVGMGAEPRTTAANGAEVAASFRPGTPPGVERGGPVLHAPLWSGGIEVVEVATGKAHMARANELSGALARTLTVVRSTPGDFFATDEMLAAWLLPQVAFLEEGGRADDLARTMRDFGFTRVVGDILSSVDAGDTMALLRRRAPGRPVAASTLCLLPGIEAASSGSDRPALAAAVVAALGGAATRLLKERTLSHACAVDVIARDVLDFPLRHTSLCRYLTLSRARRLMSDAQECARLIPDHDKASLEEFIKNGREHYVGST